MPDIFVWVAGALGLHPADVVVVEDGVAGIQAAQAAGMFTVGVEAATASCSPHLYLAMNDLRFETILAQFQKQR